MLNETQKVTLKTAVMVTCGRPEPRLEDDAKTDT